MYIHEAVKKAIEEKACIFRAKHRQVIKLQPTPTKECFLVIHKNGKVFSRWNPSVEDLVADDWDITC